MGFIFRKPKPSFCSQNQKLGGPSFSQVSYSKSNSICNNPLSPLFLSQNLKSLINPQIPFNKSLRFSSGFSFNSRFRFLFVNYPNPFVGVAWLLRKVSSFGDNYEVPFSPSLLIALKFYSFFEFVIMALIGLSNWG